MSQGEKGDGPKTATLPKSKGKPMKPRPKSLHESALSAAEHRAAASRGSVVTSGLRGSQSNLAGENQFNRRLFFVPAQYHLLTMFLSSY